MTTRPILSGLAILIYLLAPLVAEAAGVVELVAGNASVVNAAGEIRFPVKGDRVEAGDTLITGSDGEVHIQTDDAGLIALRPSTRMKIASYKVNGRDDDSVVLNLLKGAMRSITGWIGTSNPRGYAVKTPTATVGIRGTDHEPLVIDEGPDAGTYDKVNKGGTVLDTSFGRIELGPNQVGFAPKAPLPPRKLEKVPPVFKPSPREPEIEARRDALDKLRDGKLQEKRRENEMRGLDKDGKPKIGDAEDGRKALEALNEALRAYETGDSLKFRNMLDPSMIGFQKFVDDMTNESRDCKQMRISLRDTQVQAGPNLAVIQSGWEKRCLQMPDFAPRLESGRSTFLMHRGGGPGRANWGFAAFSGSSPFRQGGTLAQINLGPAVFSMTLGNHPFTIRVTDPDQSAASIQVTVKVTRLPNCGVFFVGLQDTEILSVPKTAPGVYQLATGLFVQNDAFPVSNNGTIHFNNAGCALPMPGPAVGTVVVSYTDTTPGTGAASTVVTQTATIH